MLVKPGSIYVNFHLSVSTLKWGPHSVGVENSRLLQGSDFGAIVVSGIGALLFALTMQGTLTPEFHA